MTTPDDTRERSNAEAALYVVGSLIGAVEDGRNVTAAELRLLRALVVQLVDPRRLRDSGWVDPEEAARLRRRIAVQSKVSGSAIRAAEAEIDRLTTTQVVDGQLLSAAGSMIPHQREPDHIDAQAVVRAFEGSESLRVAFLEREVAQLTAALAAALRDSGWVDPEEAAAMQAEYDASVTDWSAFAATEATKADVLRAERDALLPVAEAAKRVAEERGYRKAIADLRGEATRQSNTADDGTNLIIGTHWHAAADFLESKITGSTDGP